MMFGGSRAALADRGLVNPLLDSKYTHIAFPLEHVSRFNSVRLSSPDIRVAFVHKHTNHLFVSLEDSASNRALATIVDRINIGALLDQHADCLGVAVVCREHEKSVAFMICEV